MPDTTEYPTLSYAEMEKRYDGEWVFVADPVQNDDLEVLSGTVLAHSPDRDEMDRQVRQRRVPGQFWRGAYLCFVPVPDDISFLL